MDASRTADRITTAVQRRRIRLVLTSAARVADKAHGLAHALTTSVRHAVNTMLPNAEEEPELLPGIDAEPATPRALGDRLRSVGSALNDRVARTYNERPRPQSPTT